MKLICREIEKEAGRKVILVPLPRIFCLLLIQVISLFQKLGFVRSINKESIRKLLVDVDVVGEPFNLPYSSHEGIRRTVRSS